MAPTPDDASHLGDGIRRAYEDVELGLVRRIARAVGRGSGKLGQALAKLNPLRRSTKTLLAKLDAKVTKELPELVVEAYDIGAEEAAREVERVRQREHDATPLRDRDSLPGPEQPERLAARFRTEFHPQILRSTEDVYRRIVAEVYAPALAEGEPRRVASQRALQRFADEGVTGFVDKAGRRWPLPAYAEMAMRAAFARAAIAGALDRYRAEGVDILWVPDIPFGCPQCEPWEGRLVAMRPGVKAPRGMTIKGTVAEAFAQGFGHPGCRHALSPWAPGVRAEGSPSDPEGYKATQVQRTHERRIRAAKRRMVAAQESGADPATVRRARDDVRRRQGEIRTFLVANPQLMRYSDREQVRAAGERVERAV